MGTIVEVTVVAKEAGTARELANRCVAVARHWDDVLTTWRSDGELARLNDRAGGGRAAVRSDRRWALERMLVLSRATNGAFNPAVGKVVSALRSGPSKSLSERAVPRLEDVLTLAGEHATVAAGVRLDAGGIGKGMALDAMARMLTESAAVAWFLDFGGSSQLAHGRPETGSDWNVLIAGEAQGVVHGTLRLRGASLSTSRALPSGDPAGAIIDTRSGKPVAPPRLATVLAADATTAEAWSKALVVFGRDGIDLARAAGIEAVYEDAAGVLVTPDFLLERAAQH